VRIPEHPSYSTDLAAADFYLFPRLTSTLKGWLFSDATEIIKNAKEGLKGLPQNDFQECSQQFAVAGRGVWLHMGLV
jgi:hypothetical protein